MKLIHIESMPRFNKKTKKQINPKLKNNDWGTNQQKTGETSQEVLQPFAMPVGHSQAWLHHSTSRLVSPWLSQNQGQP